MLVKFREKQLTGQNICVTDLVKILKTCRLTLPSTQPSLYLEGDVMKFPGRTFTSSEARGRQSPEPAPATSVSGQVLFQAASAHGAGGPTREIGPQRSSCLLWPELCFVHVENPGDPSFWWSERLSSWLCLKHTWRRLSRQRGVAEPRCCALSGTCGCSLAKMGGKLLPLA